MREFFDTEQRYHKALGLVYKKIRKEDSCHVWTGPVKKNGYGQITLTVQTNKTKNFYAHRLLYLLECGSIEASKELHHECFNRICVNPEHLKVVTHAENMSMLNPQPRQLSAFCGRGHAYDDKNTLWTAGRRMCRECKRERERNYRKVVSL